MTKANLDEFREGLDRMCVHLVFNYGYRSGWWRGLIIGAIAALVLTVSGVWIGGLAWQVAHKVKHPPVTSVP